MGNSESRKKYDKKQFSSLTCSHINSVRCCVKIKHNSKGTNEQMLFSFGAGLQFHCSRMADVLLFLDKSDGVFVFLNCVKD